MRASPSLSSRRSSNQAALQAPSRITSAQSRVWRAALLQVAREGNAADIAAKLKELALLGDINLSPCDEQLDEGDTENEEAMDVEIQLGDDDESFVEEVDAVLEGFVDMAIKALA